MAMRSGRVRGRFSWPARLVHESRNTHDTSEYSTRPHDALCGSGRREGEPSACNQEQNVDHLTQVGLDSQEAQGSTLSQEVPYPQVGPSDTATSGSETQDFSSSVGTRASTSGPQKRLRGPAKNTFINSMKKAVRPMPIEIDLNTGKPITAEGIRYLPRTIQYLVRALAPMVDKKQWSDVHESEKLLMLTELKSYFDIKDLEHESVREVIDSYFRNSYKKVRKELYDYYCKLRDEGKDPINLPPQGIKILNWTFLCSYFQTPEYRVCNHLMNYLDSCSRALLQSWSLFINLTLFVSMKRKSAINKENRKKLRYTHCMGPKPFMIVLAEKEHESLNDHIDRVELFKEIQTRKSDGSFIAPEAKVDYNKMKDLQVSSESAESPMTTNDIYDHVMGKRSGYIKGLGHIPKTIKSRFSPILPRSTLSILQAKLTSTQEKLQATEDKLQTTQEELADVKSEIHALKDDYKEIRLMLSQLINLPTPASLTSSQMDLPNALRGTPNNEGGRDT